MAIFRRDDETQPAPARPPQRDVPRAAPGGKPTHIASGTRIVGEISGGAPVEIEGHVEGRIAVEGGVVVGPTGRVQGEIQARDVRVGGKVEGNIRGGETVSVLSEGSVEGDVISPRMSIADGAFFKGKVEMGGGKSERAPGKPAAAPAAPQARPTPPPGMPTGSAPGGAGDGQAKLREGS